MVAARVRGRGTGAGPWFEIRIPEHFPGVNMMRGYDGEGVERFVTLNTESLKALKDIKWVNFGGHPNPNLPYL